MSGESLMCIYPSVSVITPVYNQALYIEESVLSVLNQTYTDFELLIIDDASTDETGKIISKYASDPRISIYRNDKNMGCASTCNRGYSLAKGKFLAIIAGDDTWEVQYLEKCVSALEKYPDAGFVYTRINLMDTQGNKVPRKRDRIPHRQNYYGNEFENIVRWLNHIPHGSTLVRKSNAEIVGFYDTTLEATYDWEFMLRLTKKFPVVFINEHLYNIRIHGENVTKKRIKRGERERFFFKLLDRVYQMDDLPSKLIEEKDMIYARAYLDIAEGYRDVAEYKKMRQFFKKAIAECKNPKLYLPYRRLLLAVIGFSL